MICRADKAGGRLAGVASRFRDTSKGVQMTIMHFFLATGSGPLQPSPWEERRQSKRIRVLAPTAVIELHSGHVAPIRLPT